jgi:hypothetical protein
MISVFDLNDISIGNVFFLETRNNIIMDGKFTKMIYSDDNIVTNGIYISLYINEFTFDKSYNRLCMRCTKNNDNIIKRISEIEYYILKNFKHINGNTKRTKHLLKEQLETLCIKVYRDNFPYGNTANICGKLVLKISGVWEDSNNIGITYKLMEAFPLT